MESIGQLAAGIAHEINTPIQYVGDNLRFLQEVVSGAAGSHGRLPGVRPPRRRRGRPRRAGGRAPRRGGGGRRISRRRRFPRPWPRRWKGSTRVSHIVRAMKEFSHPGTASKVMTDLNRALDSTITVASNEWKYVADLVPDFDPNLPLVPCLPADLNQVFLNMIVNAAHAIADVVGDGSGGKGIITVSTRRCGRLGGSANRRHRHGHDGRGQGAHLRPVLHDQAGRARHGAGAGDLARGRGREARRDDPRRNRAGPGDDIYHPPAAFWTTQTKRTSNEH